MYEGSHPIHRSIRRHWLWKDKPFTRGQAWVDMILLANHRAGKVVLKGKLIEVKAGQLLRSKRMLSKEWGWTHNRTERFLKLLENDKMITQQNKQHATLITLINYKNLHKTAFKNIQK